MNPRPPTWPAVLADLDDKYRQLVTLREAREALERQGQLRFEGAAAQARAAAGQALARRFPGSLRELDQLSAEALRARWEEVQRERRRTSEATLTQAPRWVRVVADWHALIRDALAVKGWGRQAGDGPRTLEAFLQWCERSERRHPPENVDRVFLEQCLNPPEGRLMNVVWSRLAERHPGVDPRSVVFEHKEKP